MIFNIISGGRSWHYHSPVPLKLFVLTTHIAIFYHFRKSHGAVIILQRNTASDVDSPGLAAVRCRGGREMDGCSLYLQTVSAKEKFFLGHEFNRNNANWDCSNLHMNLKLFLMSCKRDRHPSDTHISGACIDESQRETFRCTASPHVLSTCTFPRTCSGFKRGPDRDRCHLSGACGSRNYDLKGGTTSCLESITASSQVARHSTSAT